MDIGDFYDRDRRRRSSDEVHFGTEWFDADGDSWRVAWLRDTAELFAMLQPGAAPPMAPMGGPLFGATGISGMAPVHTRDLTVFVLARIGPEAELRRLLGGWEAQQGVAGSFEWLVRRLDAAGHPPPWTRPEPDEPAPARGVGAWIRRHFDLP